MLIFLNLARQRKGPKMHTCCAHRVVDTTTRSPWNADTSMLPTHSGVCFREVPLLGAIVRTPMSSHFQILLWVHIFRYFMKATCDVLVGAAVFFWNLTMEESLRSQHSYQLYRHFVSTSNISVAKRELHSLANWLGSVEWDYCQKWTPSLFVCRQVD